MALKRHQEFWRKAEKEWDRKFMLFISSVKPWNWVWISHNSFKKEKENFIEKKAKEYMAIYKIKRAWLSCYYSPYTKIGIKRLNKECVELGIF